MFTISFFFFFNDTATTEIYTLSLHDALPISHRGHPGARAARRRAQASDRRQGLQDRRSEEHTSELQSLTNLVCRLLLEKKKKKNKEYKKRNKKENSKTLNTSIRAHAIINSSS